MKSLKIIQVLCQIARVIFLILFILCIIGAVGCTIAFIVMPIVQNFPVDEGKTMGEIMTEEGVSFPDVYTGLIVGLFSSGVGIFLAKINEQFFVKEINKGTPFDHEIVKDMRKLALTCIITTVAYSIVTAIAVLIVQAINHVDLSFKYDLLSSISWGIFLLIVSLFCDYGAELNEQLEAKKDVIDVPVEETEDK